MPIQTSQNKKALLIVDLQNSFCKGGALAVPNADEIIPLINMLMKKCDYDIVIASKDWHPANHFSFISQHPGKNVFETVKLSDYGIKSDIGDEQIIWPEHCIQGTFSAELHPDLDKENIDHIVKKGQNSFVDSYSTFMDNARNATTGLNKYLEENFVNELHICGLATDYCVKYSAIDCKRLLPDIKVIFIEDASRGLSKEGVQKAKNEMLDCGIEIKKTSDII